jgi:hypothetical protein
LTSEAIPDQCIVDKFLIHLPKKFKMVIITILESKDLSHFSTDELIGSLLTHETILHLTDDSIANAFKTQFFFNRGRGRGRGKGHQGRRSITSNQHSSGGHRQQNQISKFPRSQTTEPKSEFPTSKRQRENIK